MDTSVPRDAEMGFLKATPTNSPLLMQIHLGEFSNAVVDSPGCAQGFSPMSATRGTTAATYRFLLRGELGDRFAPHFDGMQIDSGGGMTILTGRIVDQAELLGLITRISDLGIELVSIEPAEGEASSHDARAQTSTNR